MNREDRMTFWYRVLWAPHTFVAAIFYLTVQAGFLLVIYTRKTGRDELSDLDAVKISLVAALAIASVYWVPNALGQYWFLRAYRRMRAAEQSPQFVASRAEQKKEPIQPPETTRGK